MRRFVAVVAVLMVMGGVGRVGVAGGPGPDVTAVLTVSKTTFGPDEGPSFAVQFKNVSKKPLAVFDLEWYWNWTIRFEDGARHGPWQVRPLIMVKRAAIVPRVLQAGETVDVAVDLGRDPMAQEYVWAGIVKREVAPIERLKPGKYKLTVEVKLQEGDAVAGRRIGGGRSRRRRWRSP